MCHYRGLIGMVVAMLALLVPADARAHGRLKSSVPAANAHLAAIPRELRLDFTEAPELTFSSIRLTAADGREIALGALAYAADSRRSLVAAVTGVLDAGVYAVTWQMAGDDGHPVRGRYEFVIAPGAQGVGAAPEDARATGSPAMSATSDSAAMAAMHQDPTSIPAGSGFGAESWLYVVIRWVQFMALLLVIGTVAFHTFVLGLIRRARSAAPERVGPGSGDDTVLLEEVDDRAARIGRAGTVALLAMLLTRLVAQAVALHGEGDLFDLSLLGSMVGGTMWGWGWLLQLAGIVFAGAGFRLATRPRSQAAAPDAAPRHRAWMLAGVGAILLAFSPGMASHASSSPRARTLAMLADGIHVLAASSWLGTLSIVLIAGLAVAAAQAPGRRAEFVRDLINAFSPVALASAGVAAATGVFAAWLHVGTVPNLWSTRYGITLLVKLAVLGVVALTGFYNWRFVKPRLGAEEATVHLRRSARVEVAVAVIVLLVTAVLVATPTSMDMVM